MYEENFENLPSNITFQLYPDIPQAPCTHFPVLLQPVLNHILACDYLIWPNPKVPSCLTVASPINSLGNFLTIEIFICPVSSRWYHGLSNLCLVAAELSKKGSGADDLLTWTVAELGECVSNLVVMIGMHVFARCIHQNSQITTFGGLCLKRPISAIYIKLQNDLLFIKYQYLQRGN